MLKWRKNLPLRKGGLVADSPDGSRYWIHRHEKFGQVYWTLSVRRYWSDRILEFGGGHWFARQKHAKECANRLAGE